MVHTHTARKYSCKHFIQLTPCPMATSNLPIFPIHISVMLSLSRWHRQAAHISGMLHGKFWFDLLSLCFYQRAFFCACKKESREGQVRLKRKRAQKQYNVNLWLGMREIALVRREIKFGPTISQISLESFAFGPMKAEIKWKHSDHFRAKSLHWIRV